MEPGPPTIAEALSVQTMYEVRDGGPAATPVADVRPVPFWGANPGRREECMLGMGWGTLPFWIRDLEGAIAQ
jgi:hypothetical protein